MAENTNTEQILQAQIDITQAVNDMNDLVKVVEKTLKKIDKLSSEVGKDLADGLIPVKDIKGKLNQVEKDTKVVADKLNEAMKIKASIDTKSVQDASNTIKDVTANIGLDASMAADSAWDMGSAFNNLGDVLQNSSMGMQLLNTATLSGVSSGLDYGKTTMANALAINTLSSNTQQYTLEEIKQKLVIVDTTRSLSDLNNHMEIYDKQLKDGIISQEQYRIKTKAIKDEAKKTYGGLTSMERSMSATSKSCKEFFTQAQPLSQVLKSLPGPLGQVNNALISTLSSVKQAPNLIRSLIATKLGVVLIALAAAMWKVNEAMENYNYWLENTKEGNIRQIELMEKSTAISSRWQQVILNVGSANGRTVKSMKEQWESFIDGTSNLFFTKFPAIIDFFYGKGFSSEWSKQRKEVISLSNAATIYLKSVKDQEEEIVGIRAQGEKDIAEQRAKLADIEGTTKAERIKAAEEIKRIEIDLIEKEKQLANSRLQAIKIQNSYADSGYKDILKEKEAEAELVRLEAKKDEASRSYLMNLKRINAQKSTEVEISRKLTMDEPITAIPVSITPITSTETLQPQIDDFAQTFMRLFNNKMSALQEEEIGLISGRGILDIMFLGDDTFDAKFDNIEKQRLEMLIISNNAMLSSVQMTEEERTRIEQENANARMTIADIEYSARQRQSDSMMNILSDLQTAFDSHTIAFKLAASADTMISGIKAAQDSYTSLSAIPFVGPGLGLAAAAASALATAKRIKDIWKVKKGDKNAPSDPSETAQAVQPSIVKPTETYLGTTDWELQKQQQQDQRVVLVYGDIEDANKRVSVTNNESTF